MKSAAANESGIRNLSIRVTGDWATRYWAWSDRNYDWLDKHITRMAIFNPFWRRVLSFFWMPFAYHSGLRIIAREGDAMHMLLPYRRPNRNWYGDMAGAALLGNAELAAGMVLFEACGADCIIVCRRMNFDFHASCTGPALYVARPVTDIAEKQEAGRPFECDVEMDVFQCDKHSGKPVRKKIGHCDMTFSVTQKRFLPRRKRPWLPV